MFKPGYSYKVVQQNIAEMILSNHSRESAVAASYAKARVSYFKRFAGGALPKWLSFPETHRLRRFYSSNGAPLKRANGNPVRELTISPAERKRIQGAVNSMFSSSGKSIRQAAKRYTDFTGHEDVRLNKVSVPNRPKIMLAIGHVDGIMYSTVRDGEAEKYHHRFRGNSRPLLTSSPDGNQLYLLGGAYNFTERGIVDKTKSRIVK